jgi:hypothetical protein
MVRQACDRGRFRLDARPKLSAFSVVRLRRPQTPRVRLALRRYDRTDRGVSRALRWMTFRRCGALRRVSMQLAMKARIVDTSEGRIFISELKTPIGEKSHCLELHSGLKGADAIDHMLLTRDELEELKNALYAMITGID